MKVSEIIAELEKIREDHGDITVVTFDSEEGHSAAGTIEVVELYEATFAGHPEWGTVYSEEDYYRDRVTQLVKVVDLR